MNRQSPLEGESGTQDSLVEFALLTFAGTWISWTAWTMSRSMAPAIGALFFFLGVFAPSLTAIWLTRKNERRVALNALLARVFQWRVSPRWYLFAVFYFVAIKLGAAVIYRVVAGEWPRFSAVPWYLMVGGIIISTPVQFGEEVGWRGYALPRLAARFGFGRACIVLGVMWAAWHLPLFFIPGTDTAGQPFVVYMLGVTALSVAIGWQYQNTRGSLLLAMLMHSAVNNTNIVPFEGGPASNRFALSTALLPWLSVGLLWIGALYFLARMRRVS